MATQNFRVKNGLEVGIGVTIDGTSGIVSATKFDGNLNVLGNTYYVATTGSDANSGNNINEPYLTIAKALSVATNGDIINISAGTYEETCPLTVPRGVTVKGAGLRATTIRPDNDTKTNDVFRLNDVTTLEDFTIRGSYFKTSTDTGYSFTYAPGIAITTRSPYIQRVTVLNFGSQVSADDPYGYDTTNSPPSYFIAGAGAKVDGSLVAGNSLEAGMLFNEVTFFTPNNKGIVLTNGARAEYLNCFHYFASQAIVGTSGTVGIAGTANARLKFTNPGVTPALNDVVKLYEGGSVVAIGTIVTYNDPYATISGKGYGTFTSAVGIGSTQDVRFFQSDGTTQTGIASAISFADYKMFGAEMRSVGCAVEYGQQGVVADGVGVQLRLFATNFNHVGSGKDFSNDPTIVVQSNEVLESNGGQVSYVSIDQSGDFRVGDSLYINQQTGQVSFASTTYDLENIGNFSVTDGVSNQTLITPTSLTVGNLQLAANTFSSTSGDIIINPGGSSETTVSGNLNVTGILTASVLQTSALQINDTSIALDDTGSNGTIRFNTDGLEAFRITNNQNVLIGDTTETGTSSQPLQVNGGAYISGNVGIGTDNPSEKLHVHGGKFLTRNGPYEFSIFHNIDGNGIKLDFGRTADTAEYMTIGAYDSINNIDLKARDFEIFSTATDHILRAEHDTGRVGIGTDNPKHKLNVYNETASATGGILVQNVTYSGNEDRPYLVVGTKDWTGATTNWNTYGFQHRFKVNPVGSPRITIDSVVGELFCIQQSGDVGIGTDNPTQLLHLEKDIPHSILLKRTGASPSECVISNSGDLLNLSNNTGGIDFATGAVTPSSKVRIDGNGYVGIGTDIPGAKLEIYSNVDSTKLLTFKMDRVWSFIQDGTGASTRLELNAETNGKEFRITGEDRNPFFRVSTYNSGNLSLGRVHLCPEGGLVGIGTDIPESKLTVAGGSATARIEIKRTNTNAGGSIGAINFTALDGHSVANISALADGDDEGAHLVFRTTSAAGENSPYGSNTFERLRITSDGRVGIGTDTVATSSGGSKLEVYDNGISNTWRSRIVSAVDGADKSAFVGVYGTNSVVAAHNRALTAWETLYVNAISSTDGGNVIMSGNVGIGTINPTSKLDVRGHTRIFGGPLTINDNETTYGYGHIRHWDNYHAIILRGYSSDEDGNPQGANETSFVEYGGIFNFYKTNGTVNNNFVRFREDNHSWINTSSNVGIGTDNPLAKLSVGSGSINDGNVPIQINAPNEGLAYYGANNDGSYGALFGYDTTFDGGVVRVVGASDLLKFVVNNTTTALTINPSGDVGIGLTNPTRALEIYQADPILEIRDTSTSLTNANATLRLAESNADGATGDYWDIVADTTAGNWGLAVKEGTTTRLVIGPTSGNVGINSTAPTAKLDVNGDVAIASTVSIGTTIDIIPYNDLGMLSFEGSQGQLFAITNNLSSGSIFSVNPISGIPIIDVHADRTIQLNPYGGNTGIGTTNPTEKLDVVGNLRVTGISSASSFESTVASGTAPFVVASDTLVTNLNADKLDGLDTSSTDTTGDSVVTRSSGNFSAGTITANLTGNATSSNTSGYASVAGVSTNIEGPANRLFYNSNTDTTTSSANLTYDGSTLTHSGTFDQNGTLNVYNINIPENSDTISGLGTTTANPEYYIGQTTGGGNDFWKIYADNINPNKAVMVFEIQDDDDPDDKFIFRSRRTYSGANVSSTNYLELTRNDALFSSSISTPNLTLTESSNALISGPTTITIDPATVGDNSGTVIIKGDLQIDGTTTTVNSTTITIDDKNIVLGSGSINDAAADGGGITLESGDGDKTFEWINSTDSWTSSEHIDIASGKVYKIDNTEVLSATTLGINVVNSSLTSVGTIVTGTWQGTAIDNVYLANSTVSYGGVSLSLGGSDATPAFNLADATGLPISTGVDGLGTNVATFLGTPSSANLAAAVTDETGTGSLVFSTDPTFDDQVSIASTVNIGSTIDIVPYNDLGALSFEGSAGQLFSITNNLTSGSIFAVNDVSGIPSIDVDADGTIQLAPYGSTEYVGVGTTSPTEKLDVVGTVKATTFKSTVASGTAPFVVASDTLVTNLNADKLDGLNTSSTDTTGDSVVTRSSGNFSAGTITANLSGTASDASAITVAVESSDTTCFPVFVTDATGSLAPKTGSNLTYDSSNGTLSATIFSGSGASLTSIPNGALVNSTISGIALGSNLGTLTLNTSGNGLSGSTTYDGSGAATFTVTSNATSANTNSAIVSRDADGNFSAGTITADRLTGSSISSPLDKFVMPQNPEGKHVISPFFFNDQAYARLRGATIAVTEGGSSLTLTATEIDKMFNASGDFWGKTVTAGSSSEIIITLSSIPKNLNYGSYMGVTFGNPTWRAKNVKLEAFYNSTWNTVKNVTDQEEEFVVGNFTSLANQTTQLRWTFSNYNFTELRIVSLFAYNFNSSGMDGLYVSRDGGSIYNDISVDGTVTATTFSGALSGNATTASALQTSITIGGVSFDGSANIDLAGVNVAGTQDTSGNAATATKLATARTIGGVSFDGSANIDLAGVNTAGTQDTSGNAATATKLATSRTIGGVSFDGSANIDLAGVNVAGTQDTSGNAATATKLATSRTIGGVSFDGSANIDLAGVNVAGTQDTSGNAATATNLAGGSAGNIPYQSGANTTAFLGAGTAGQVLTSNGSSAPSWADAGGGEFTLSATGGTIASSEAGTGGTGASNFFAGFCAGYSNTTGSYNNFFGINAGCSNTSGCFNNFFGRSAGTANITGCYNNFFGNLAGCCNTESHNNFFGGSAGRNNSTGTHNNYMGYGAGTCNTTGSHNNFLGYAAGSCNSTGSCNNFFGRLAGRYTTTGSNNIFFGNYAGFRNTTGANNFFAGQCAGYSNTFRTDNIFIGFNAGRYSNFGYSNIFLGGCAGANNTDGGGNVFIGGCAGRCNTTGTGNIFIGSFAGQCNTTGKANVFIGDCIGTRNSRGCNNIFLGSCAGNNNTSGSYNNFFGRYVANANTTGGFNNYFGRCAGVANTSGSHNNFFGSQAGYNNTTGCFNNFFGNCAGRYNTTGSNNTFIGQCAGYCNRTGANNIFIGSFAGFCNAGCHNNFFGAAAGRFNTTGSCNNFFGNSAGYKNTTGSNNNFFGQCAGYCNTTGANNLFFGCNAGHGTSGLCNVTTESNHIVMGNSSHTDALIQIAWTTVSDCRDKCIFGNVSHGRGFLQNINPIEYAFKDRETGCLRDPEGKRRYGFSAQNILEVEGDSPVIVNADNPESLKLTSEYIIPILVNAIKELDAENKAILARLEALENR